MYRVTWRQRGDTRTRRQQWEWARHDAGPNRNTICEFPKRAQATQWIRNHYLDVSRATCTIVHPDGYHEWFYPRKWQ
jgi:hypothetical protein